MSRPIFLTIACGAILFYAVLAVLFRPFVADDAYIVGRYAENVIRGHGLVYNPGEYVSALTSPLHALLLTGIAAITEAPVAVYRWIGVLLPVLGWAVAILIYRPSRGELAVVTLVGLASPFLVLWAGGGLETPILSALLTVFAAVLFRVARRGEARAVDFLAAGVLAGFAFLTRFDSVIITLPPMLAVALMQWRRPALWVAAILSAAIAGSWLVFSYIYYGDVLPTSAYIKLSAYATKTADNVAAIVNVLIVSGLLVWAVAALVARRGALEGLALAISRGAAISAIAFGVYAYSSAGVHMMFSFRFFMPLLIVAAMIVAARVQDMVALRFLLPAQAALQLVVAGFIHTTGMNVYVLRDFGPIGYAYPEYHRTTPREYGGFMLALEESAADLNAHWQATGAERKPRIYMYTGGMGYWLPDFYVFETLASYRHHCERNLPRVLASIDYIQDLDISVNPGIQSVFDEVYAGRAEPDVFGQRSFPMGRVWNVAYRAPEPYETLTLPVRIGDPCPGFD